MNEIKFREPRSEDAKAIVAFYNKVGGETTFLSFGENEYPLDLEGQVNAIESMNNADNCKMILAFAGERIVGLGTITSNQKKKSRHSGELGIVVSEEYQGKGIGRFIIEQLLEWTKSNGITTRVQLDARCDNELAVKLYERLGFEVEGRLKNAALVDNTYYDLYVMGQMVSFR